jgi:hypothetical protein
MGRGRPKITDIPKEDDPNYTDTADESVEDIRAVFVERGMDEADADRRARDAKQRMEKSKHTGQRLGDQPGPSGKGGTSRKGGTTSKGGATKGGGAARKGQATQKGGSARKSSARKTSAVREAEAERRKTSAELEREYSPAEPYRGKKVSKR